MIARLFCACFLTLLLSCSLFAQEQKPAPATPPQEAKPAAPAKQAPGPKDTAVPQTAKPAADKPFKELPYTPSLDLMSLDRTADPCNDLYQFACGGWKKNNPIPSDQARWSVYGKTHNENLQYLWGLLEETGKATAGRSPVEQKTGDYFAACMDEAAIERAGYNPILGELRSIQKLRNKQVLAILLGKLHLSQSSAAMMFGFGADQDPGNSEQVIAFAFAGGLGLPDRDYYTKDDAKSQEIRGKYVEHIGKTLELVGYAPAAAAGAAKRIMEMETALAKASLTRVEQRDPYKIYHKMPVAKLQELTPSFDWTAYFKAGGAPAIAEVNVTQPKFFEALEQQIKARPLGDWKLYLTYHLVARARRISPRNSWTRTSASIAATCAA